MSDTATMGAYSCDLPENHYKQKQVDDLRARLAEVERERNKLLEALEDVIGQACIDYDDDDLNYIDSMGLSAYAHGIRLLAKYGRCTIEHDVDRWVIAR